MLNINELIAGFRMFPSYIRIGGLREDLPRGFHEAVRELLRADAEEARRVRGPAHRQPDLRQAHAGRRQLHLEQCYQYGLVGPMARAAGSTYDVRKAYPTPLRDLRLRHARPSPDADVFDRYRTRIREMHESIKICTQALDRITPTRRLRDRRPAHRPAAEGQGLHRDGSADSALPDPLAGLHRAGRRGIRAGRGPARRARRLHRVRRHQPSRARAPRGRPRCWPVRRWSRCSSARSSPTSSPSSARPTSSWETWTGEFPSRDAVRGRLPEVRPAAVAGRRGRSPSRPSSAQKFEELATHYPPEQRKSAILYALFMVQDRSATFRRRCGTWPRSSAARRLTSRTSPRTTRCSTSSRSASTSSRCAGRCRAR